MWFVYAMFSAISGCFSTIFGKLASQRVDPTMITTLRSLLMSIMLIGVALITQQISFERCCTIQAKDWLFITLTALAGGISWLFYFSAFKYGLVSKVVSVDRLSFIFIIFLSAYIFGEELTWGRISGATLMVMGIMLIAVT